MDTRFWILVILVKDSRVPLVVRVGQSKEQAIKTGKAHNGCTHQPTFVYEVGKDCKTKLLASYL